MSLCSYEWEWFNNIYAKSLYPTFRKEIQSLVEFFYRWIGPIKFKISECAIWYRYLNNRSYQRDMLHDAYPCGYKLLYTLEKVTCKTLHLWSFISTIFLSPSFKGIYWSVEMILQNRKFEFFCYGNYPDIRKFCLSQSESSWVNLAELLRKQARSDFLVLKIYNVSQK